MSSVRKICLRFDRVQRKSDPYHLAYFLLTSIEKNYQEGRYTFLYSNYLFVSYLSIIEDNIQREKAGF